MRDRIVGTCDQSTSLDASRSEYGLRQLDSRDGYKSGRDANCGAWRLCKRFAQSLHEVGSFDPTNEYSGHVYIVRKLVTPFVLKI